ncbi:hypothetical protein C0995_002939 [Termitomyces sp. Mi166|nr:hypothetical protein C0995_002939 [Termitomyces sp. Mi166\
MSPPSFSASRRVNPPGITPVLTEEQVWKGLGIKARNPQTFVPMITSCQVLSDDGTKAYFEMESTGTRITNIVSYNEEGELILTFSFANGIPVAVEGKTPQEVNGIVGKGVEHTIRRIRELASNLEL